MAEGWRGYEGHEAAELAARYERLAAREVHSWLIDLLPDRPGTVLDVGAGSGRDAAWLAAMGHDVVAVEPSAGMREEARRRHPNTGVRWVADSLPGLAEVYRLGLTFDVILLSAVWMHVAPSDRQRAFRKLVNLLRPGGLLAITLRLGPPEPGRQLHHVSAEELGSLAKAHGIAVIREYRETDRLGRADVTWAHLALRLPVDGTGALPLLRHVILNDQKSATYKLGLLRRCRAPPTAPRVWPVRLAMTWCPFRSVLSPCYGCGCTSRWWTPGCPKCQPIGVRRTWVSPRMAGGE